jgi:hypothetical protein
VNDIKMLLKPSGCGHIFESGAVFAGLLFFANLILGRGLGSITETRFAFGPDRRCDLPFVLGLGFVKTTAIDSIGSAGTVSTEPRKYETSNLSALVRVSCTSLVLIFVGSGTASSVEGIEAVTLVANNPPRTARQNAEIQTVLITPYPHGRALPVEKMTIFQASLGTRSINLNFSLCTIRDRLSVSVVLDRG